MRHVLDTPRRAASLLLGYFLLLGVIKLTLFAGLSNDDSEQLLYSQSINLLYDVSNPPLYTWLLFAVQQLVPPSALSVTVLKFGLLAGCYWLVYLTGREAGYEHKLSVTFAVSLLTLYHIVWEAVRHFSHSVLLAFSIALTTYALVRLARRQAPMDFFLFGSAVLIGCFAKYNYFFFLLAVMIAACVIPRYRNVVFHRFMAAALFVVALALLPYGLAMEAQIDQALASAARKLQPEDGARLAGLVDLASSFIGFQLPFLLIFGLLFVRGFKRDANSAVVHSDLPRLLLWLNAVLLFELLALTLISETSRVKNHLLFVTCLLPAALLAWSFSRRLDERAIRRFWAVGLVLALLVPVILLVKLFGDVREGEKSYFNVPYEALAAKVRELGMEKGLLVTSDAPYPLSGNLRIYLSELRIATSKYAYTPPVDNAGACLLLWESKRQASIGATTIARARDRFGITDDMPYQAGAWELPMAYYPAHVVEFSYRFYPEGAGDCR